MNLVESFNCAIEGFIYVIKTQKNMRIHFLLAVLMLLLAVYLDVGRSDILVLALTISLVLIAEMVNTALELTVDMVSDSYHHIARIIKDIAAGAVLISSINAILVGYIIFAHRLDISIGKGVFLLRQTPAHITFLSLILVIFLTVVGKALFQRGTPMRGGMPSGHSAVAFSFWTVIAFTAESEVATILGFLIALMVAQSRIKSKIHNNLEVIAGALLGTLVTALLFQIFA